MVRVPAVKRVNVHEPEGALPLQLSPVVALTVTVPLGVPLNCGLTLKLTVIAWPAIEGLGGRQASWRCP